MKQAFRSKAGLSKANLVMLDTINEILDEYVADNFTLTLRQLYYQLVSRDIIPNNDKEYSKISKILTNGRMAGLVDWSAIEDRVRQPKLPYWVRNVNDAISDTISQYRLDRQRTQKNRVEVWVEKDALSSVLYRVTSKYHVRLMVNRGYSSASAMYDAYRRLNNGDTILYFGDHDPSGMDMIRDVSSRLTEFGLDIKVIPVALTMAQIQQFNPPPNPAKISDPRAKWYIEQYGEISWELDALPPKELISLLENAVTSTIDLAAYQSVVAEEEADIEELKSFFNR